MIDLNTTKNILQRWKRDESGTAALSWALSLTVIIGAMGAAMDFAMLSSADGRAQTIADTTALAAAIYVKNNEVVPTDRNKGLVGKYKAAELGYTFKNSVIKTGDKAPTVNVTYDNVAREATVIVEGYTRPSLVQILGFEDLKFSAGTVVKYYEKDIQDPASIVMVLDNSGSMHFDDLPVDPVTKVVPPEASQRMAGLKSAAKSFMSIMETAVGPQPQDGSVDLVLRTGMMAFDSAIVRTTPMDWGYIADGEFDAMQPLLATNSAPPLTVAKNWLNVTEPPIHEANLPGKTPLKYIILMTDGKNTVGEDEWVARTGTKNWRRWVTGRTTPTGLGEDGLESYDVVVTPRSCGYEPTGDYKYLCSWDDGYGSEWHAQTNGYERATETFVFKKWTYTCHSEAITEYQCTKEVTEPRWNGWEYQTSENAPDTSGDWQEGEFDIESNIKTREECDELHEQGVEIFTVGFALTPGQFGVNDWPGRATYGNHFPADVDPFPPYDPYTEGKAVEDANKAKAILQYCASKPENFITANDTATLQTAFDRIGNTIIKEIVRISS